MAVDTFLDPERPFRLRPSHIRSLHRVALAGLSGYAGNYTNDKWLEKSPIHLSSYVMWRLNWIHPFTDGNGRTSRAASYLGLCIRLGYLLPGKLTIPDQISTDKTPYYRALEAADESWSDGLVDLTAMKQLLNAMLATQLLGVHSDSQSGGE